MSDDQLAHDVANALDGFESESVSVSAMVLGDRIGYPRRVVEEDGKTNDGELKDFDEAYDFASTLFQTTDIGVEKDDKYVWFTDNSS
jgi:hypothetical protein